MIAISGDAGSLHYHKKRWAPSGIVRSGDPGSRNVENSVVIT